MNFARAAQARNTRNVTARLRELKSSRRVAAPQLIAKLVLSILVETLVFAGLLFVPAGTLAWWRAWAFLGVMLVGTLASSFALLKVNADLIAERLKPPIQKDQPLADKIVLAAILTMFIGVMVLIPLDVFRWHLHPIPSPAVSAIGALLLIVGWWLAYVALRENAFAAPVVKLQSDRKQAVVDTGPYRVLRHPLYAGGILYFVGLTLWLQSYTAALIALFAFGGLLMARILVEESFLRRGLPGYAAYMQRVRYRFIPFVW